MRKPIHVEIALTIPTYIVCNDMVSKPKQGTLQAKVSKMIKTRQLRKKSSIISCGIVLQWKMAQKKQTKDPVK